MWHISLLTCVLPVPNCTLLLLLKGKSFSSVGHSSIGAIVLGNLTVVFVLINLKFIFEEEF